MGKSKIEVAEIFQFHRSIAVGLFVASDERFPLVVGCSFQTLREEVIDIPARLLQSPGLALWTVNTPPECAVSIPGPKGISHWQGKILFALWPNFSFKSRLADTGWVPWRAPWRIGASLAGIKAQEDEIERTYGHRQDVWLERDAAGEDISADGEEYSKMTVVEASELLGLVRGAIPQQIRAAYIDQIKKYHPDRVAHLAEEFQRLAAKRTRRFNQAYELLMPKRKV